MAIFVVESFLNGKKTGHVECADGDAKAGWRWAKVQAQCMVQWSGGNEKVTVTAHYNARFEVSPFYLNVRRLKWHDPMIMSEWS